MIPSKVYDAAITSGTADTAQAQIAMTPEMYELLSAGIYEDRVLAIIREMLSNGRDSQKEAGNGDKALEVHLPTAFEPFLSFRDFGTGLTHEQVFEIYLTYGASTKRGSNEFVGMFGIGSKSPLSYTDSFLVTTYLGGLETQYNIYKDNGIPKIAKLIEKSTTESNGLKVTVAIRKEDFYSFEQKMKHFAKLFDHTIVNERGDVFENIKYTEQNDLYWIPESHEYEDGAYALMGGVPYRLSNDIRDDLRKDLKVSTMILPFDLGSLNIASSRENLSFIAGDATDSLLKSRVEEIKKVFTANMEAKLKGCLNVREVTELLFKQYGMTTTSYWSRTTNMDHIVWGGKTLHEWRDEMLEHETKLRFFVAGKEHNKSGLEFSIFRGSPQELIFFDGDRKTGNIRAIRAWSNRNRTARILLDVDPALKALIQSYHGLVDTVSCEAEYEGLFPKVTSSGQPTTYRKVSGVFCRSKGVDGVLRTREVKEIDGTETGYYVDMFRDTVTINSHSIGRSGLDWLVDENVVEALWFVRGTSAKKNRPPLLTKLDDHVEGLVSSKVNQRAIKLHCQNAVWKESAHVLLDEKYKPLLVAGLLKDYPTLNYYNVVRDASKCQTDVERVIDNIGTVGKSLVLSGLRTKIHERKKRTIKKYNEEYRKFWEKYPVLEAAQASWRFSDEAKEQLTNLILSDLVK